MIKIGKKKEMRITLTRLPRKTVFKRRLFFIISDILLITFSMFASFWLRFNGEIPELYLKSLPYSILLALAVKLTPLLIFNLYDISWRFVSLDDLTRLLKALSLGSLIMGMILFFLKTYMPFEGFPRSILLLDYLITLILIGFLRISKRLMLQEYRNTFKPAEKLARVLVVGAGDAGEQIVREMIRNPDSGYLPVGFIDDDVAKEGIQIHGVRVVGNREDIPRMIRKYKIEEVLIALSSVYSREIKKIVDIVRNFQGSVEIKILPNITDLMNGNVTLSDIHEIKLEDLLGRTPVEIDRKVIEKFIKGKKILITGAGGSIGSELVKTVLRFDPEVLIAFDIDETDIFNLVNKLKPYEQTLIPVIGDVKDEMKLRAVFRGYSPQIVIHSAAYKHVPILEQHPDEAVKTNIFGTKVIAELSLDFLVEKFIFISTDKAINPTSVMGASKRVSEELLKILNMKNKTKFISVRFGNVLGSRGSVIPLFKEQIGRGGPVTVTHPEMKRYFMITSEAVLLVLEAAAIGQGGEVFVLDMGRPVKIIDLAEEMIRLSGYEPDQDIPIVFSGVRPGEKLYEEILSAEEGVQATDYEKIYKTKSSDKINSKATLGKIRDIIELSFHNTNRIEVVKLLEEIVPSYTPSEYKQLPRYE